MSGELSALRAAPLAMEAEEFRDAGHRLVDELAALLAAVPKGKVTHEQSPSSVRRALDLEGPLPAAGAPAGALLVETARRLFAHSLFNGHPRFFGYITASPAPIGMLADLLAAAVNPNCGAWVLSPAATEIEAQAVRWIAELIGYPAGCGGLMVSGGNMANFVGFFAARAARAGWDVRAQGVAPAGAAGGGAGRLRVYGSRETHTWIQKAADLSGLGTASIRWIPTSDDLRVDLAELRRQIAADRAAGDIPFLVVGTGGSVMTGAVDDLPAIAGICAQEDLWFHVDGAYGAVAAAVPEAPDDLRALALADSVAVDPHKWLYAPLEAGCALVRDPACLRQAFAYHPPYYHFDEEATNFVDYGPQNSRGFRALKVWLQLRHAGGDGYRRMISDDIALSREMAAAVEETPGLELVTQELSITTFRFVPPDLAARSGEAPVAAYLDALNAALVDRTQREGEAFVSNAVVRGRYVLRACIVNFRTDRGDVRAVPAIVARVGRALDREMRANLGEA